MWFLDEPPSVSPGHLLQMQVFGPTADLVNQKCGDGAQQSVLTSLPGDSYAFSGLRITSTGSHRCLVGKSDELC